MDYGDQQCVGCDPSTKATYRTDANWYLCDECYEDWLDMQKENSLADETY